MRLHKRIQNKNMSTAEEAMTERSIPHIRDIFSPASAGNVQQPHDSAVCTSCEDECPQVSEEVRRRKSGRSRPRQETDLKYLERHLSMKKTIRKKMMRDLQQAFVADPEVCIIQSLLLVSS